MLPKGACSRLNNPCQNGGQCIDANNDNNFVCNCQSDFVGDTCESKCTLLDDTK